MTINVMLTERWSHPFRENLRDYCPRNRESLAQSPKDLTDAQEHS